MDCPKGWHPDSLIPRAQTKRVATEAQGYLRYLRPEFQCPEAVQGELIVDATSPSRSGGAAKRTQRDGDVASTKKHPWPKTLPDQVQALRVVLAHNVV